MKRKFIINPSAGKHLVKKAFPRLEERFKKEHGVFDYVLTRSREDSEKQTATALKEGYEQIIAVGGDGTLNSVINGFFEKGEPINPEALLAVSQWGTGCDYFKTVSGGSGDWMDFVTRHDAAPVDIGEIAFRDRPSAAFFTNIGSVGMSAAVVLKQRSVPPWMPALIAYSVPALTTLLTYRSPSLRVTLDGKTFEGPCLNLFFAKGKTAGGGMKLGGGVALNDGNFDVTLIKGMGLAESLPRFPKIYTGRFSGDEKFIKTTARTIEVTSSEKLPVEFDGEVMGTTDIRVTVRHRAIRVCFPKGLAPAEGEAPPPKTKASKGASTR